MHSDQPASRTLRPGAARALRIIALVAVGIGVAFLAAAAFVLSYPGIHAIARQAGVTAPLARIYPLALDAMLVVAGSAVLALRGAGVPSRMYAWLSLVIVLAGLAAAGVAHATGARLAHRDIAAAAAIVPWVLVLAGFGLLVTMLRHARLRRTSAAGAAPAKTPPVTAPGIAPHGVARAHYRELAATERPPAPGPASAATSPAAGPPRTAAGSAEPVTSPGPLPVRNRQPAQEAPGRDAAAAANAAPGQDEPDTDDPTTDQATLPAYWRMVGRAKHSAQPAGVPPAGVPPAGVTPAGVPPAGVPPAGVPAARTPQAGPPQGPPGPPDSGPGTVPPEQLSPALTPDPQAGAPLPGQARQAGDPIESDAAQDTAANPAFDRMHSSPTPPGT